jgi:hypothetical protein
MPKRRANNAGTIFADAKGNLHVKGWFPCDARPSCPGAGCIVCGGKGKIRRTRALGTDNERLAKTRAKRLLESAGTFQADAPETFKDAAERVASDRRAAGIKSAKDELARLRLHAFARLGTRAVKEIRPRHVNEVLDAIRDSGKSKQLAQHVKQAISNVFAALRREGTIEINPAEEAELPAYGRKLRRTRAVLTDAEFLRYLAWEHPEEKHRGSVRERQTMSAVSRCFGGLRTGDLHALRWRHLNPPDFAWGMAPRQKTAKPQPIVIPAVLRPLLLAWYESHGRPGDANAPPSRRRTPGGLEAPVFPTRRDGKGGSKAGATKAKASHAHAFRRDLRRAFGLEVWDAAGGTWKPGERAPTPRERELLEGTAEVQPVDFHSWRRGFRQALDGAQLDAASARALGGWESNLDAIYAVNPDRLATIPIEALPPALPVPGQLSGTRTVGDAETQDTRSGWQDLNLQQPAPKAGPLPG